MKRLKECGYKKDANGRNYVQLPTAGGFPVELHKG